MTGAGVGGHTGRGYRAAARGLRTWWRMLCLAVALSLIGAAGAAGWKTWRATTSYEWYSVGMLALAETLIHAGVSPHRSKDVRHSDGRTYTVTLGAIANHEPLLGLRRRMIGELLDAALLGFGTAAGIVIATLAALRYMGGRLKRGRRLRGGELVSARQLRRRTAPPRLRAPWRPARPPGRPYRIAGVPWPQGAETRHTVVSGTTGAGKTVLIADLVEQIRARGERCVLYDKMGSYTETFFDPARDTLLNPLDARAPRWSPFLEARNARDFDTMAAALIPRQKDTVDPFWITAARQLFSHGAAVFWKRGETRNRVLVEHLLKTSLDALAEAMEGTVAQSIVDPANPKTALSVRAMLTANIGALELLPDEGNPFSIRDWIETGEDSFLFLTSRGDQHASLRGLISTWLEIAVNALLSLPRDDGRRVWVILDELPTLHQVPSLRPGLAESRQFGGCFVLGVQVFSALRDLYGRDGAETISGLCGTRVVLAAPDRDTAEWSAESLGRAEVEELAESVSYGVETPRDGVTLGARRALRPLVLPAEIARLDNLAGYLKFPGSLPVARIGLRYRKRPKVAARFVPREERDAALPDRMEVEEAWTGAEVEGELHAGSMAGAPEHDAAGWPDEAGLMTWGEPGTVLETGPWEPDPPVEGLPAPDRASRKTVEDAGRAGAGEDRAEPERTKTGTLRRRTDERGAEAPAPSDGTNDTTRADRMEEKDRGTDGSYPPDWL